MSPKTFLQPPWATTLPSNFSFSHFLFKVLHFENRAHVLEHFSNEKKISSCCTTQNIMDLVKHVILWTNAHTHTRTNGWSLSSSFVYTFIFHISVSFFSVFHFILLFFRICGHQACNLHNLRTKPVACLDLTRLTT